MKKLLVLALMIVSGGLCAIFGAEDVGTRAYVLKVYEIGKTSTPTYLAKARCGSLFTTAKEPSVYLVIEDPAALGLECDDEIDVTFRKRPKPVVVPDPPLPEAPK